MVRLTISRNSLQSFFIESPFMNDVDKPIINDSTSDVVTAISGGMEIEK